MNSGIERFAVLMGNSDLSGDRDYLGFDGETMGIDFKDYNNSEDFSEFRSRRKRSSGGFRGFLEGVGISPEASRQRRDLRTRKQTLAEQQQKAANVTEQQNLKLQQQAITQAASAPSGEAELSAILSQPTPEIPVTPADQGFWKSLKTWQKGAIVGGAVLVVAVGGYLIYKKMKK